MKTRAYGKPKPFFFALGTLSAQLKPRAATLGSTGARVVGGETGPRGGECRRLAHSRHSGTGRRVGGSAGRRVGGAGCQPSLVSGSSSSRGAGPSPDPSPISTCSRQNRASASDRPRAFAGAGAGSSTP